MMTKFRCDRCDGEFANIRKLRRHPCPAVTIRGSMPLDLERQRFYRRNPRVWPPKTR